MRSQTLAHQRIQVAVGDYRFAFVDAREIEKLADRRVDVLDVLSMPALRARIALVVQHLEAEADARKRRAQIVRYAGEQQRALVVQALQIGCHLVERAGERADFGGPGFGDGLRHSCRVPSASAARVSCAATGG